MSATTPNLAGVAARIFDDVTAAMQTAEEIGGQNAAGYFALMAAIAAEAVARMRVHGQSVAVDAADAKHARALVRRIGDALGTGEGGDALVGVAFDAAGAERRLAALETAVASVDAEYFDNADSSIESIVTRAVGKAEWRQAEIEDSPPPTEPKLCHATIPGGGFADVSFCTLPKGHEGSHR
jgi:hypothetical protein